MNDRLSAQYWLHEKELTAYSSEAVRDRRRSAMERFENMNVELILGGHLHRAYIGNSLDFYPGTHRDRGIIIAQCGTTTSRRGRGREAEKNSLNLIEIRRSTITITHYMYFHESDSFEAFSRHTFRRAAGQLNDR